MTNYVDPFLTYIGCETDPKYNGPDQEMKEFFVRQNIIFDFLYLQEKADTLLDCLDEQGINPDEYISCVEESINFIATNNIKVTDAGLWLPQY